ncbi:MAG TPA: response regulator [Gemmatimonadetes bacterium]|nr:response regulator [Gemmatimonadota bacterium]
MPDQPAHQRGGRILVVDDEPHIRRVLCTILTSHGFDVTEAKTAPKAWTRYSRTPNTTSYFSTS